MSEQNVSSSPLSASEAFINLRSFILTGRVKRDVAVANLDYLSDWADGLIHDITRLKYELEREQDEDSQMSASKPHISRDFGLLWELFDAAPAHYPQEREALTRIQEQFEALRLAATRQLTPLDVAATHIDILRRKSEDYTPQERDNVAAIVESHVKEARTALFAAISNPATESAVASGADKRGPSGEPGADSVPASREES